MQAIGSRLCLLVTRTLCPGRSHSHDLRVPLRAPLLSRCMHPRGPAILRGFTPPMPFHVFLFVIGMTFQVSDVQVTATPLRRLVLAHGVISFFFSVAVLALAVNLGASLI